MSVPVTRTKVIIPRRRSDLLSRQRLLDLLYDLLDNKLIIVAAPAGYGKTSLLIDFARQVNLPVCWYSLDPLDRDPQRFIAHLIASLSQRFPSFGAQSSAALNSTGQAGLDLDRLATAIVNEAYEHIHEHFLLVLDDYHLVSDQKEIDAFINRFVQEVDENCHLILASRSLLTIPDLPLMVARSQVGGLSFEELAFRTEEIRTLISQNYKITLPPAAAEELARETEGWITGLLLSAQTMWQGMADRLRVARVSGVGLYEYLAQQVLDQQPAPVRNFLLRSSLLEEFDAVLCQEVWGPDEDWPGLIDAVLQNNLFVLPVGEDGLSIRYHHLFSDFLQSHMEQECPQEKDTILQRLVAVFARRSDWERAYAACQRLGDLSTTADLIEQAGPSMFKNGRITILTEWIEPLPENLITSRPNLRSLQGGLRVMQGQVEQGLYLLKQAEAALRVSGDLPGLARTLNRRAVAHRLLGDYLASLEAASESLSLSRQVPSLEAVRAEALRVSGTSLYHIGQLKEAIQNLSESLSIYDSLNERQKAAMVLMELGLANMSAGHYRQSLSCSQQALVFWLDSNNTIGQANVLNNLGVLHHLVGEYEKAASLFEEALSLAKQNRLTSIEAYTLCSIGDLYADLGAEESALEAYHRARQIAQQVDNRFLLFYVDLAEAAQARRTGRIAQARQYLESAGRFAQISDSKFEYGLWRLEAGRLSLSAGDGSQAVDHFKEAAARFKEGGQRDEAARTGLYLAVAFASIGNLSAAIGELESAFTQAAGLESQHILVVAGLEGKNLLEMAQKDSSIASQASRLLRQVIHFENRIPSLRRRLRGYASSVPFAPPKLTIRTLGKALVELDGKPVTAIEWHNQKRVREFFFFLLSRPDGLTKEAIGLVFWPDSSPAQLKLQFKNTIYRLRHSLGPDIILFDEDRYWFNRALDYEYDAEAFQAKLDQAQSVADRDEKIGAYQAAVEYYKGPYLPEIEGSWVWPERERLWRAYTEAMLNLAALQFESGLYNLVLDNCQHLLAEDACLEEAHRLAMRAYAARGNRAAVARQFERCRQALLEEVNTRPSRQTEALYRELND